VRGPSPVHETYRDVVPPSLEARKQAFAQFVRRAVRMAEQSRGWSVPRIAAEASIGNQTIYRWMKGDWKQSPHPDQVVSFCDALDIPVQAAFMILWPGKADKVPAVEPPPMDPDVQEVLRRLTDPNVPSEEKYLLRETIRQLAARPATRRTG
jgi:transcriptional regulator with XRE-family HTH domain